jgi:hypothetical protein
MILFIEQINVEQINTNYYPFLYYRGHSNLHAKHEVYPLGGVCNHSRQLNDLINCLRPYRAYV